MGPIRPYVPGGHFPLEGSCVLAHIRKDSCVGPRQERERESFGPLLTSTRWACFDGVCVCVALTTSSRTRKGMRGFSRCLKIHPPHLRAAG